jgi:hypothetical protein
MRRNYSLPRITLVLATACAVFLPGSGQAQEVVFVGTYNGFSHGGAGNDRFLLKTFINGTGLITILGNTYSIRYEVDNNGNLEFNSGRAGPIKGTGKWQDLTRGGALIIGTYKLSSGDQGKIEALRNFTPPPDPDTPPDIAGHWGGTFESVLSLMRGTVEWDVQQDLTETGAPGTGFTGQERIMSTPAVQLYQFAGAIDAQGNFVRIGVSAQGFVIEGGKFEAGQLTGQSVRNFADGGQDDLVFVLTRN